MELAKGAVSIGMIYFYVVYSNVINSASDKRFADNQCANEKRATERIVASGKRQACG